MSNLRKAIDELARNGRLDSTTLLKHASEMCRAVGAVDGTVLAMRSGGSDVSNERRDELLAKCQVGEYVELEIDILAYEQKPGVMNRNFTRFRDGELLAMGRTGRNNPFLRDHAQRDTLAKGGVITASKTEKRADGDYAIMQTAKLTAPWAVELALRGLLDTVSIGWNPTGPVLCSACNAQIYTKCYHWPGDRLAEVDTDEGGKRKVRKADGPITVEWIFTGAELVETSAVNVPAVPGAHIEGFRATLAAGSGSNRSDKLQENEMNLLAVLATMLTLAPSAGEDEVIKAVDSLKRDRDTARKELTIADSERTKLAAIVEGHQATERQTEEDAFIRDAVSTGRITLADEGAWRDLYQANADRAKTRMAERAAGCSTPVGQPRQSTTVPTDPKPPIGTEVRTALAANGVDADQTFKFAKLFGAKNPEKTIGNALGLNGEG